MTPPISTYCYYRTKYHISQENFKYFVQTVENPSPLLGNTNKGWGQQAGSMSFRHPAPHKTPAPYTVLLYISHEKK